MPSETVKWKPGSFTKNFSWGSGSSGLIELYESIRLGFAGTMADVPRETFRQRVANMARPDYIPINFFLFNKTINGQDFLVADELVFQALTSEHSLRFDKLALFAFNFSYVGKWTRARSEQRRPALWAYHYIKDRVAGELNWDTSKVNKEDIKKFVSSSPHYQAQTAEKLSTNLAYLYRIGRLAEFGEARIERWWVDALFLALDRLIEDRLLDGKQTTERDYGALLAKSGFPVVSGKDTLEKNLASQHLVTLYAACGSRNRFSEEFVKARTISTVDIQWVLSNDQRPRGAVHRTNPRIVKSIPCACAMLAVYAGFDVIDPDEMANFDLEAFIRSHTLDALAKLKASNVSSTMSSEDLMKLTRDK